jgi:SAM-dependent methyltransferase
MIAQCATTHDTLATDSADHSRDVKSATSRSDALNVKDRDYDETEEGFKDLLEKLSLPQEDILYFRDSLLYPTSHFGYLLDFLNAIPNEALLLDLCCGVGSLQIILSRKGYHNLLGLDLNKNWIKFAKKRAKMHKVEVSLLVGDAHHLPFRNSIFDVIVVHDASIYLNLRNLATEISRALRVGGLFWIDLYNKMYFISIGLLTGSYWRIIKKLGFHTWRISEATQILERSGLKICRIRALFEPLTHTFASGNRLSWLSKFLFLTMKSLGLARYFWRYMGIEAKKVE